VVARGGYRRCCSFFFLSIFCFFFFSVFFLFLSFSPSLSSLFNSVLPLLCSASLIQHVGGHGQLSKWVFLVGVFLSFLEEEKLVKIGEQNFLLPLFSVPPGKEERLQCRSEWHSFELSPFCFFKQCMKRRCFSQNSSFHLNENDAKHMSKSKSVFNL